MYKYRGVHLCDVLLTFEAKRLANNQTLEDF
jgi:hypothetical protein